jgi:CRP-like cAMP-binding protein
MANAVLNNTDIESITAHFKIGSIKNFKKGEIIIQGTYEPEGVYLIIDGYVKAYSISPLGQINLLLVHGINEIMPMPWALDGAQKVGIFYETISNVRTLRISKHYLRTAMGSDPWLTEQVLRQFVNTFTAYAQRIQSLRFRLPRERIIPAYLI